MTPEAFENATLLQALAAELGLTYVETSAKTAERVEEAFDQIARLL